MYQTPDVIPLDLAPLASTINLPYQLTPGRATGSFLAGLGRKLIVGSRCPKCKRVEAPAQDCCTCGNADLELVQLSPQGELRGFTQTPDYTLALIRLDGTDADLLHRVTGEGDWRIGMRVEASWVAEPKSTMLDLVGFVPSAGAGDAQAPKALPDDLKPVEVVPTSLQLNYRHAHGPYYGRLFDEMETSGRIMGIRCTSCQGVLLPPREICDACYAPTGTWVDVKDTGVLQAFSIIHLKFVGQTREPPYVYAEIILDGASTKIIHVLDGVDIPSAPKNLKPGMRVKAVWKEIRRGSLNDISHFELIQKDI